MRTKLLALATAVAVSTGLVVAAPQPAGAAAITRIAGGDRYDTAAKISQSRFGRGVPVVYVMTGRDFPDALAAGPAASLREGPVLLVDREGVPAPTAAELDRLDPGEIVLVGGEASVTSRVEGDLGRFAPVRRVQGGNRFATAAAVSADAFDAASTVFVANGYRFPDALAATPAAHNAGGPLLLVTDALVPPETEAAVKGLGASRVVILGGLGAVGQSVEDRLRQLVPRVDRYKGEDRSATSVDVSFNTFGGSAPIVYLATGFGFADALAGGPVAALNGGPILLVGTNCVPKVVDDYLNALNPAQIVLLGGSGVLGTGVEERTICPYGGAPARRPGVAATAAPAWDDDGPDPDLVRFGNTWYLYTTGTTWGNNLGVLVSDRPDGGWRTVTGQTYGSTALANIPAWQDAGHQWAPGVYFYGGRYIMFYAAKLKGQTKWCISVATADTPRGPFRDNTSGPIICQSDGSIDPHPFVDANGQAWLHWKNNDEHHATVSKVWAVPLGGDGVTIIGGHREVMAKNSQQYPWQTTVDNPQMVMAGGVYYLFHTGGDYIGNDSYSVGYATCAGPVGPCSTDPNPILQSYGDVAGPGGGTVARDQSGNWWMSYHAWTKGCTNYSCGGRRKVYVAPLAFN